MAAPLAYAGGDAIVEANTKYALLAKGFDQNTNRWVPRASRGDGVFTQISGTSVTLTRVVTSDGIVYTFTTPQSSSQQILVFRLTITAENGTETATDDVTLTIPAWQIA